MTSAAKLAQQNNQYFQISDHKYAISNTQERDYSYLMSLAGIKEIKLNPYATKGLYIMIGDTKIPALPQDETACVMKITPTGAAISAANYDALSYGIKEFLKLIDGDQMLCGRIEVKPTVDFRGVHICLFNPIDGTDKEDSSVAAVTQAVKKAALEGHNYVVLEFWGTFPYQKHPYAVWEKSEYTREEITKLVNYMKNDLHITPIPGTNMTSHAGWSRIITRQHVVLDKRPDLSDMWIPGGWCFATTNPKTQQFLSDCIDELTELFQNPPYVHCGCDKCFGFGSTEEDRTQPADKLFAEHIKFLHSKLAAKGAKMIMWADMLYSAMDALYWKASPELVDCLPKDIVMNIWTHNDIGERGWDDVNFFESRGFKTLYAPFLDIKGAKNMINLCKEKGSLGILQTSWHRLQTSLPMFGYSGTLMKQTIQGEN